jgi:hypothetical protein
MTDRRFRIIQAADSTEREVIASALDERTIKIAFPAGRVAFHHQVLGIALTDLLGRLFPRISFDLDLGTLASAELPPGPELFVDRLEEARSHGTAPQVPDSSALRIGIGPVSKADIYADGIGWCSYLGTEPSRLKGDAANLNPLGPLIAASRAAAHGFAHLFSDILGEPSTPPSAYFSAFDYRRSSEPFNDPAETEVLDYIEGVLVGAGSVGGAAVYAFSHLPHLHGRLAIVDPQSLEAKNPDRALLATSALAEEEAEKVAVAAEALRHFGNGLVLDPRRETVNEFLATREREERLPLVLCAVDSPASRRSIQDCLPLDLINAACNASEATVSGHRTGAGPCVCCLQMRDVLDRKTIRWRLIAAATGLERNQILGMMVNKLPLDLSFLRRIEEHREMAPGSLSEHEGLTIEELWRTHLAYGETEVRSDSGLSAAVASPWITSLAGFLLAAEALKRCAGDPYVSMALGPGGPAVKWEEKLSGSPLDGISSSPPRWAGSECLCRSPRRRRIMIARYGLSADQYPP